MQIRELESLLGIAKENIRYYESEGLISPQRKANGYRDYSKQDVETLKKILVLRKIGVPVADIRDVLNGTRGLNDVLRETRQRIEGEISSMEEAKKICEEMEKEHTDIVSLDADRYLHEISSKPQTGFADLTKDVLNYTSELFVESFGHLQWFFPIFKPLLWKRKRKGSPVLAVIILLFLILGAGAISVRLSWRLNMKPGHYWLRGMLTMCAIIFIWIILRNITYFLSKRFAKKERLIAVSGAIISALVSILLYFGAILHWQHILMFEPYTGSAYLPESENTRVKIMENGEFFTETDDGKASLRSRYYISLDQAYNTALKKAILDCEPSGVWSVLRYEWDLTEAKDASGNPCRFYQIMIQNEDSDGIAWLFLIQYDQEEWLLDEPQYGVFRADEKLVSLVQEYDRHLSLQPGYVENLRSIFEYDPKRIWKDDMYHDGRFDTYRYLTLTKRDTGEDVTEQFIKEYREAFENEDWETLLPVYDSLQEIWRSEYVNPEAAHME